MNAAKFLKVFIEDVLPYLTIPTNLCLYFDPNSDELSISYTDPNDDNKNLSLYKIDGAFHLRAKVSKAVKQKDWKNLIEDLEGTEPSRNT